MRRTSTEEYWRDEFIVTDKDVDYLLGLLLHQGLPFSLDDLALIMIKRRCQEEEEAINKATGGYPFYQPRESYKKGQKIIFSEFDNAIGTVVEVRKGNNPRYSDFRVIEVQFDSQDIRQFAAEYRQAHFLNVAEDAPTTPEEIYERYGSYARETVEQDLKEREDFVRFGDQWFLRDLMVELHIGHLNLAEAIIDVAGKPLPPEEILKDLELPAEHEQKAQVFSLNYSLSGDDRFHLIGDETEPLWYLVRLMDEEPEEEENPVSEETEKG
ncbi:MAG: hypothetical protein ACE5NP_01080 [Anaerolineae bacterium]